MTASGRLRLDALARYLQLVAEDDVADAGLAEAVGWLVRRSELRIRRFPVAGERLALRTFCSGTGPRWAERTTTVSAADGDEIAQARAIWAAVGPDGRPAVLSDEFLAIYGAAAGGRTVSARLSHPRPEPAGRAAREGRDWPLRVTDFDTAGHVNNTAYWAAVEEILAAPDGPGWLPNLAEIEHHRPTLPGTAPRLLHAGDAAEQLIWLTDGSRVLASARLAR